MKNKLTDLNDTLFAQLERLSDEDLAGDKMGAEIKRAETMIKVADAIVENARLQLEAAKFVNAMGGNGKCRVPALLGLPVPQEVGESKP